MPRIKQKTTHSRQRQRLIDACISALHIYGPSRTTVEKVVAIAKLSPGIVRFYFASKAAMLVASLQYLAAEFDDQLLAPVSRLKDKPVAALRLLVELYLDPELASPRKVSVWYAFWGEASSRQEYYDICGQKDEGFAALVREIIERLIVKSGLNHLDADGVALGLIGVLEMLWQEIAFKDEADIDRSGAKARAMAYLRSVFPGEFNDARAPTGTPESLPAWVYGNPRLHALERERIFLGSWQFAALQRQLAAPGDFVSSDLGFERVLLLHGGDGELRAFRNSCPAAPHTLLPAGSGRLKGIRCHVHGLAFGLDGRTQTGTENLLPMEVRCVGEMVLVRAADRAPIGPALPDHWQELTLAPQAHALPACADARVAADWKVLAELFLGLMTSRFADSWSSQRYRTLTGDSTDSARLVFLPPNHWISVRADGWTLTQILPSGPGASVLRRHAYTWLSDERVAHAAEFLAERAQGLGHASVSKVAESIQRGMVDLGHGSAARSAEVSAFQRQLLTVLPQMALEPPAGD